MSTPSGGSSPLYQARNENIPVSELTARLRGQPISLDTRAARARSASGVSLSSPTGSAEPSSAIQSGSGTPHIHSRFEKVINGLKMLSTNSDGDFARISHSRLVRTATGVRNLANQLGKASISLRVRSVLIVTKARDNSLVHLTREVAIWLMTTPRYDQDHGVSVYVDAKLRKSSRFGAESIIKDYPEVSHLLHFWTPESARKSSEQFDMAITLGGDGTVLYVGSIFQQTVVPPVMSFSLGSLGFLANYSIDNYQKHIDDVFNNGITVNLRMRFTCSVYDRNGRRRRFPQRRIEVLNDLVIDRGPNPFLCALEIYGNDALLTRVQADGLILSTPTGSTAYSMSAGGALVHPEIPAICVTPICPHTLTFRPMLLPDSMRLRVSVPNNARSTAWVSFDGRHRIELNRGDYITVQASQYPFPTIGSGPTEFIDSVSRSFHWNTVQEPKPLSNDTDEDEIFDIDFD